MSPNSTFFSKLKILKQKILNLMSTNPGNSDDTLEEELDSFVDNVYKIAVLQGGLAYFLMSIHAVRPDIFNRLFQVDIKPFLWANMVYGITALIFSRPSLRTIAFLNRLSFGILGSLMFNHSSMLVFDWLRKNYGHRSTLVVFLGILSGRIMMVHLLAFLYHLDTRYIGNPGEPPAPRNPAFENMYI